MTAASHSLIARGLLSFDLASGESHLNPQLAHAVSVILAADRTLRIDIAAPGQMERSITLFVAEKSGIIHELSYGVVSQFGLAPEGELAAALVPHLGALPRTGGGTTAVGEVRGDRLERWRQYAAQGRQATLVARLVETMDADDATTLAGAMCNDRATWISLVQLEADGQGDAPLLAANHGIFVVQADTDSAWAFATRLDDPMCLAVYRADRRVLATLIGALLKR